MDEKIAQQPVDQETYLDKEVRLMMERFPLYAKWLDQNHILASFKLFIRPFFIKTSEIALQASEKTILAELMEIESELLAVATTISQTDSGNVEDLPLGEIEALVDNFNQIEDLVEKLFLSNDDLKYFTRTFSIDLFFPLTHDLMTVLSKDRRNRVASKEEESATTRKRQASRNTFDVNKQLN